MSRIPAVTARDPAGAPQQSTAMFRHALCGETLLALPALSQAARLLPPGAVERRVHDARDGAGFRKLAHDPHGLERLAEQGAVDEWVMLTRLETLPAYAGLFDRLLAALHPAIRDRTGHPRDVRGFVFVSAPGTHTPLHFDAEWNVLFQIEGTKTFATLPAHPPFLTLAEREAYHATGENLIAWHPDYAAFAQEHALAPGDALFVPYEAPHYVRNGDAVSISLSVTWQDRWSRDVADAARIGPILRRFGISPHDPLCDQGRPRLRAIASRMVQRAETVSRRLGTARNRQGA